MRLTSYASRAMFRCRQLRTAVVILGVALAACGDEIQLVPPSTDDQSIPTIIIGSLNPGDWAADPIEFDGASFSGDSLHLHVAYGGGCKDHEFSFVVSKSFLESDPVQTTALLTHDSHDDPCVALIRQRLSADLGPLKLEWQRWYQRTSGEIVIRIQGLAELLYRF